MLATSLVANEEAIRGEDVWAKRDQREKEELVLMETITSASVVTAMTRWRAC